MGVDAAGPATEGVAKRLADAVKRQHKADAGDKPDAPKQQEPTKKPEDPKPADPKPEDPAPAADARAGGDSVQPPDKDQPPRAIPRPKAALSGAKEGAAATDAAGKDAERGKGKSVAGAIKAHIEEREQAGDDQSGRRARLEEAQHQGDLQVELALDDARDGKADQRGYEDDDATRAIKERGLTPVEQYDATGRAIIAEQLAEESARFQDAQDEQLKGRTGDAKTEAGTPKVDLSGMSAEERAVAYQTASAQQSLLARERDVLAGGRSNEPTDLTKVDIDDDGKGGDLPELDNGDRDARVTEINGEMDRLDDLHDQIAATFTDEELDALRANPTVSVAGADGEATSVELPDSLLDTVRENRDRVATERPDLVPTAPVADQPDPAGATGAADDAPAAPEGAGGAGDPAPAAPAPLSDDELLDRAAQDGVIDGQARDRFSFNDQGELVYAAQPGDGYWQAAEHVAPPAGQDFATHWRNTWTENSTRAYGVPDEQMVHVDQPIVIPGYSRDQFAAAYPPPAPEPAPQPDPAEGAPTPPAAGDVPVSGEQDGANTNLTVGGQQVTVTDDDFTNGKCTVDGKLVDQTDVQVNGDGGGYTATVERSRELDGSNPSYRVIGTAPAAGSAAPEPTPQGDPAPQGTPAPDAPAGGGADADPEATVVVGQHEVYAHGLDAADTSGGGVNLYQDGTQLVHVFDDGRIQLAAGTTEADVQAWVSQQLLYTDPDANGARQYGYDLGGQTYGVESPNAVEGLDILMDYFVDHTGNATIVTDGDAEQG